MIRTVPDKETKVFSGDVFLCCGVACLTLESGNRYLLEDDEFHGRLVSLFREMGLTDHTDSRATAAVEVTVERTHSVEHVTASESVPEHRIQHSEYAVNLIYVRLGKKEFAAGWEVCREMSGMELSREFM